MITRVLICLFLFATSVCAQPLDEMISSTWQKYERVVRTGQVPIELQPLHVQLTDPEAAVRIKGVQALSLVGGPMGALLMLPAIDDSLEKVAAVRIETAKGLGEIGGRQALEVLGVGLKDPDPTVRMRTVESLRFAGTVFAVPYISIPLNGDKPAGTGPDPIVGVRLEAVRMLRKIGTQFSMLPLADAMTLDKDPSIRRAAADALGEIGKKERDVAKYLGQAFLQEKDLGVKREIIDSLGHVRDRAGLPFLQQAMQDPNLGLRMHATQVYGRILGLQ